MFRLLVSDLTNYLKEIKLNLIFSYGCSLFVQLFNIEKRPMKLLNGILLVFVSFNVFSQTTNIEDNARDRVIPVKLYYPENIEKCTVELRCPVVFLSAGYGMLHTDYSFLAEQFSLLGYLTIAIKHELPGDPALSVTGNLYETRSENWIRGSKTLEVVRDKLIQKLHEFNFDSLILVGHSNGGDIASWLGNQGRGFISDIITLDHRRVPLPKTSKIKVISIRASDYLADIGVLPTPKEQVKYGSCVVKIEDSKHNDFWDGGSTSLKNIVLSIVKGHLNNLSCQQLKLIAPAELGVGSKTN